MRKSPTIASLFSCGGMVEAGALQAGYRPIWGIELDPSKPTLSAAFADSYERNFEAHVIRKPVQEVDWAELEPPDVLWASPVCTRMSSANTKAGETELDIELAGAIAAALETLTPQAFCLENVRAYQKSQSLQLLRDTLNHLGYGISEHILDAADYGVPQSRVRLILRAVSGQFPPPLPPPVVKRMGWYEAIVDLIPSLPDSKLANWQLSRLPPLLQSTLLCSRNGDTKSGIPTHRAADDPAFTKVNTGKGVPRAFLIERSGARSDRTIHVRTADEPSWTLRAAVGTDQNGNNRNEVMNAWLEGGRVVSLTPRALARLQTLPDWYVLPTEMKVAGPLVGNGVPCLLAQVILESIKPLVIEAPQHEMIGKSFPVVLVQTAAGDLKPHTEQNSFMQNYTSDTAAASCDERVATTKSFRVGDRVRVVKCSADLKSQLLNRPGVLIEPKSLPAGADCLVALDRHRSSTISSFPFKFEQLELEQFPLEEFSPSVDAEVAEEDFLDLDAPEDPWLFDVVDEVEAVEESLPLPAVSETEVSEPVSNAAGVPPNDYAQGTHAFSDEVDSVTQKPPMQEAEPDTAKDVQVEVVDELTVDELADRHRLELRVERAFYEAGRALRELRDRRLYRDSHPSDFIGYCRDRFDKSKQAVNYLIAAVGIYENLTTTICCREDDGQTTTNCCRVLPTNESQLRPMTSLEPEQQRSCWREAVELTGGKVPSAEVVKGIVERLKDKPLIKASDIAALGNVFNLIRLKGPERKYNGCWAIACDVSGINVKVDVHDDTLAVKPENLKPIDSPDVRRSLPGLLKRIRRLRDCGLLDRCAYTILESFGRQTYLTPIEEKVLSLLEKEYGVEDDDF